MKQPREIPQSSMATLLWIGSRLAELREESARIVGECARMNEFSPGDEAEKLDSLEARVREIANKFNFEKRILGVN